MTLEWRHSTQAWTQADRREEAKAARAEEKRRRELAKRRTAEEQRAFELHEQSEISRAVKATSKAEQQVQKLTNLLLAALAEPVVPIDFEQLKTKPKVPSLDLGTDASPEPAPDWQDFAPRSSRVLGTITGLVRRGARDAAKQAAQREYDEAVEHHAERERARRARVEAATKEHDEARAAAEGLVADDNRKVDEFRDAVLARDRLAVAQYFEKALAKIRDPRKFGGLRRVGYAPESSLVVVEWTVPRMDLVPPEKELRYSPEQDAVVVHRRRSSTELRAIYYEMLSQMALRAAHFVFRSDPDNLAQAVAFNAVADRPEPRSGEHPCLASMRATRHRFDKVRLDHVDDAVEVVRRHFGARLSEHPEDLAGVPPLVPFDRVDPEAFTGPEQLPADDARPDLGTLGPPDLQRFLTTLFARIGWSPAGPFSVDADGQLSGVVIDPAPGVGGRYHVQLVTGHQRVTHTAVRRLVQLVQQDKAVRGLLLTTGGFSPQSIDYANGRRVDLYDGHQLLGFCHRHGIPARIGRIANATAASLRRPTTS